MMTVGLVGMKHPSLAAMVDAVKIKMSRESLHMRFTTAAVAFMTKCVTAVLREKVNELSVIDACLLSNFKKIHIVDSSSWDISPALKNILPGSGGAASTANCKIQLCYEYLRGALSFFEVMPGRKSDQGYSSRLPELLSENELLITDLGYFCLKTFHRICSGGAFFLSRFLIGTGIFDIRTNAPIDLCTILQNVSADAYELSVIMGATTVTPVTCRLICLRVSEEVANERRRKHLKKSKKNKHAANQQHLFLAGWILMVTNVPQQWLVPGMVRPFYSLRWQIELIFKQMKSVLAVDLSNTGKEPRFCCQLLGRLIVAILIHRIHAEANANLWNSKRKEISMDKIYKRIQERAFIITNLLVESVALADDYIKHEVLRLLKNCRKLTQKSRLSTLEFLEFGLPQKVRPLKL